MTITTTTNTMIGSFTQIGSGVRCPGSARSPIHARSTRATAKATPAPVQNIQSVLGITSASNPPATQ